MRRTRPTTASFGACAYLPDREWISTCYMVDTASPEELDYVLESGYRRIGSMYYTPVCLGCEACISLRIPVATFVANKNQRQIWRRNQDLDVTVEPVDFSEEKYALYYQYQQQRWDKEAPMAAQQFIESYVQQPGVGVNFCYRLEGRLVGLGWVDITPRAASSVYFAWDCEPRRSLGIFSVMCELEWCRQTGREHLYMGLYVQGCASMDYKATFSPHQRRYRNQPWTDRPDEGWPLAPGAPSS